MTKAISWLVLAGVVASLELKAAQDAAPEKSGLPTGQKAPVFTLKDQNGVEISLSSLLKKGPVALVFYRSADW